MLWRVSLLVLIFGSSVQAAGEADLLKAANLPTDAKQLLDYIKHRTKVSADEKDLKDLVDKLASDDQVTIDKATGDLVTRGALAIPILRSRINDAPNPAVAERAKKIIAQIEGPKGVSLTLAVITTITNGKPEGAIEALLSYLPFAEDASIKNAIADSLNSLAFADGKADPALLKALESNSPSLRILAVEALTKQGEIATRVAVKKLLADKVVTVRMSTAMALMKVEDVDAIPVLIEVLGELPKAERGPVELALKEVASDTAPKDLKLSGNDETDRKSLKLAWENWWKKVDGTALLDEFRSRTLDTEEEAKIRKLVKDLGDPKYKVRELAQIALTSTGPRAIGPLSESVNDMDLERSKRVKECLESIRNSDTRRVPPGTARLAALRKAQGASKVMIDYIPYADEDESIIAEITVALTGLASVNGKPDEVLVNALGDKNVGRRIVAAEALCRGAGAEGRKSVMKLLKDENLKVRQTAAVALAVGGEKDAVPVLIELVGQLVNADSYPSQDILIQIAGDNAPKISVGETADDRKKASEAWKKWWNENEKTVNLAKLSSSPGQLGYTLVVYATGGGGNGYIVELDRAGKVLWEVKGVNYPVDAFVVPGGKVLVTEWSGNAISEWETNGKMLWRWNSTAGSCTNAQRLPNGNTFVCTTSNILELDRERKQVYSFNVPAGLTAAYKMPNGNIAALRNDSKAVIYDTAGKELRSWNSNRDSSWTSGLDLCRNGNILISQPSRNKIEEMTTDGKSVVTLDAPQLTTATKTPAGTYLLASHSGRTVTEIDRTGKKVWEHKGPDSIFRARRR